MGKVTAIAVLGVGVLGLLLLGLTAAQHQADMDRLAREELQTAADHALIVELGVQLQAARTALAQKPSETLVTVTAPCREDVGSAVPVFARESRVYAGR